jgi:NADH:ubiquinone oxidoreductase subunit 6 (subunit J)
MLHLLLSLAAVFSAYQVMRQQRLLYSSMWLALTSALVSVLLFVLGAAEVAVMELSVGAGLVTVLFVFAFSIVGEHTWDELTLVPRPVVWMLVLSASFLLGWFTLPLSQAPISPDSATFASVLWEERGLDVLAQIVLIFAGVLGLLGLLAERRTPVTSGVDPLLNVELPQLPRFPSPQASPSNGNGRHAEEDALLEEAQA